MTSCHNKIENVLNDRHQVKTVEKMKKVENINEIMEPTDLMEWFNDESSECKVMRCKHVLNYMKYQNVICANTITSTSYLEPLLICFTSML